MFAARRHAHGMHMHGQKTNASNTQQHQAVGPGAIVRFVITLARQFGHVHCAGARPKLTYDGPLLTMTTVDPMGGPIGMPIGGGIGMPAPG
jgi:hypothetical protein